VPGLSIQDQGPGFFWIHTLKNPRFPACGDGPQKLGETRGAIMGPA